MARTIKRLSPAERSESAYQYAMLAVFLTSMIGFTLYAMSGAFLSLAPITGLD